MDTSVTNKPLVSVTICTYNRASFIKQAIQSAIDQSYSNMEIIVIDDASTDNTYEIVSGINSPSKPVRYFKNPTNLGLPKTRNESIRYAQGVYVAILDSDDYWVDMHKIESQVEFLESNPDHALVGTFANVVDESGKQIDEMTYETNSLKIKDRLLVAHQFVHSSVLYRVPVLERPVVFDTTFRIFEDYNLILKLARTYKLANLPTFSTAYRKHSSNISNKMSLVNRLKYLFILIKNFPYYQHRIQSIRRRIGL